MRPLELATKSKIQTSDDPLEQKQLVTYEVWTMNARFWIQKTANFVLFIFLVLYVFQTPPPLPGVPWLGSMCALLHFKFPRI